MGLVMNGTFGGVVLLPETAEALRNKEAGLSKWGESDRLNAGKVASSSRAMRWSPLKSKEHSSEI